jgi:hypothetical protein
MSSINLFGEKSKKENILKRFATVLEVNEIVAVDVENLSNLKSIWSKKANCWRFERLMKTQLHHHSTTVNHEKKKVKSSTTVYRPLLPFIFEQPNVAKEEAKENNVVNVENTFPDLIWPVYGENCTRTEVDYYFYT